MQPVKMASCKEEAAGDNVKHDLFSPRGTCLNVSPDGRQEPLVLDIDLGHFYFLLHVENNYLIHFVEQLSEKALLENTIIISRETVKSDTGLKKILKKTTWSSRYKKTEEAVLTDRVKKPEKIAIVIAITQTLIKLIEKMKQQKIAEVLGCYTFSIDLHVYRNNYKYLNFDQTFLSNFMLVFYPAMSATINFEFKLTINIYLYNGKNDFRIHTSNSREKYTISSLDMESELNLLNITSLNKLDSIDEPLLHLFLDLDCSIFKENFINDLIKLVARYNVLVIGSSHDQHLNHKTFNKAIEDLKNTFKDDFIHLAVKKATDSADISLIVVQQLINQVLEYKTNPTVCFITTDTMFDFFYSFSFVYIAHSYDDLRKVIEVHYQRLSECQLSFGRL